MQAGFCLQASGQDGAINKMATTRHPNANPIQRLRVDGGHFRTVEEACTREILKDLSFLDKDNSIELPTDVENALYGGELNRRLVSFKKQEQLSEEVVSGNLSIPKEELIKLIRSASKTKEG